MYVEQMFNVGRVFSKLFAFFVRGKQTLPPENSLCVNLRDESLISLSHFQSALSFISSSDI